MLINAVSNLKRRRFFKSSKHLFKIRNYLMCRNFFWRLANAKMITIAIMIMIMLMIMIIIIKIIT